MAHLKNWNPPKIPNSSALYSWGGPRAPYAPQVFYGYKTRSGLTMLGRNWIKVALAQIDLGQTFAENLKSVNQIESAFKTTARLLDRKLTGAIEGDYYAWPRRTRRRNKTVVYSPRNIVDIGKLRDSQSLEFRP